MSTRPAVSITASSRGTVVRLRGVGCTAPSAGSIRARFHSDGGRVIARLQPLKNASHRDRREQEQRACLLVSRRRRFAGLPEGPRADVSICKYVSATRLRTRPSTWAAVLRGKITAVRRSSARGPVFAEHARIVRNPQFAGRESARVPPPLAAHTARRLSAERRTTRRQIAGSARRARFRRWWQNERNPVRPTCSRIAASISRARGIHVREWRTCRACAC